MSKGLFIFRFASTQGKRVPKKTREDKRCKKKNSTSDSSHGTTKLQEERRGQDLQVKRHFHAEVFYSRNLSRLEKLSSCKEWQPRKCIHLQDRECRRRRGWMNLQATFFFFVFAFSRITISASETKKKKDVRIRNTRAALYSFPEDKDKEKMLLAQKDITDSKETMTWILQSMQWQMSYDKQTRRSQETVEVLDKNSRVRQLNSWTIQEWRVDGIKSRAVTSSKVWGMIWFCFSAALSENKGKNVNFRTFRLSSSFCKFEDIQSHFPFLVLNDISIEGLEKMTRLE